MLRFFLVLFAGLVPALSFSQYDWKLEKDQDGIKVYTSVVSYSAFKAIKVECTFTGNYTKLISVLSNVAEFKDWVYHNNKSLLIKQNSPHDLFYYTETRMPWPLSNRDLVIHLQIRTDSLPKFLLISGRAVMGMFPEIPTRVRVSQYTANWKVTMPSANSIHIDYILEVDPAGSIPAWVANSFADKGPFGSFSNLAVQLLK